MENTPSDGTRCCHMYIGVVVPPGGSLVLDAQLPVDAQQVIWTPTDFLERADTPTPTVIRPQRDVTYRIAYRRLGHGTREFAKSFTVHVSSSLH